MDFSEDTVDEIFEIFQVESEEIISRLNNNLLKLEKNPNNKDAILSLFRDAHSLKGASRMIGLNNIQKMTHKIEDILGLAKEDELDINTDTVNILYSSIDFLNEIIKKSIAKKKQIFSEDFAKHMAKLDNITETAHKIRKRKDFSTIDKELIISNFNNICTYIINMLILLMKLEEESSRELIEKLGEKSQKLFAIFENTDFYNTKNYIENIKVKIDFTLRASGILTFNELCELHNSVDKIIEELKYICGLYNIAVVDFYGKVFDITQEDPNTLDIDVLELYEPTKADEVKIFTQESISQNENEKEEDENIDSQIISLEPIKMSFNECLNEIKEKFEKFTHNKVSAEELIDVINSAKEFCPSEEIKQILDIASAFFDFSIKNEVKLNDDILNVIREGLDYCSKANTQYGKNIDFELILNRLSVVKQVLELNESKEEHEAQPENYKEKLKKLTESENIINTGEIKVLRVDSRKLDELIEYVNELTIEKIKTKKHMTELNEISQDYKESRETINRLIDFIRNSEKTDYMLFSKQFTNLLTIHNKKLTQIDQKIEALYRSIQENDIKTDSTIFDISNMVKNIRILPFATVFHLFGRMVRDIALEKGKKINFEIKGSEICADKKIIEEIKTPLIHIIRNSIDHGIETPEERIAAGKPAQGEILLSVTQDSNNVIIEIKDDGRGLDIRKIKEKALNKGFLTPEEIASMSEEQITGLIFAPGFSTGETVTEISGRGIGLDVVQSKITQLNGKLKVVSEYTKGCCTQIVLPTAMSILKAFIVNIDNQFFAIPVDSIQTVLKKSDDEIITRKNRKSIVYQNEKISLFNLSEILGIKTASKTKKYNTVLIVSNDEKRIALNIDKLVGEQEVMLKKLSAPFYKLKNISGITTLISGEICLILNINDIINNQKLLYSLDYAETEQLTEFKPNNYNILLVDDSITTITLAKTILSRIGYNVFLASHPLEAFKQLESNYIDLIITDFEMPEMNGVDFLEKLKSNKIYKKIPVIFLSSIYDNKKRKSALAAGACEYILKGEFDQDRFNQTIQYILQR